MSERWGFWWCSVREADGLPIPGGPIFCRTSKGAEMVTRAEAEQQLTETRAYSAARGVLWLLGPVQLATDPMPPVETFVPSWTVGPAPAPLTKAMKATFTADSLRAGLARAIFDTDKRVMADIDEHGDSSRRLIGKDGSTVGWEYRAGVDGRLRDRAWTTDRNGWATEAKARAESILAAMGLK